MLELFPGLLLFRILSYDRRKAITMCVIELNNMYILLSQVYSCIELVSEENVINIIRTSDFFQMDHQRSDYIYSRHGMCAVLDWH